MIDEATWTLCCCNESFQSKRERVVVVQVFFSGAAPVRARCCCSIEQIQCSLCVCKKRCCFSFSVSRNAAAELAKWLAIIMHRKFFYFLSFVMLQLTSKRANERVSSRTRSIIILILICIFTISILFLLVQ